VSHNDSESDILTLVRPNVWVKNPQRQANRGYVDK
jgi:hypothetical protein